MRNIEGPTVALVELGFGAEFIPIYLRHPDVACLTICDTDETVLSEVGDRCEVTRRARRLEEILARDDVDAVHLVTPIPLHASQTVGTLCIEPGSPWENGYLEPFNGKLRDELLAREVFDTLPEAKVLVARWRGHYSAVRTHSSPGYRPPAPQAVLPRPQGWDREDLRIMAAQAMGLT